MENRFTKNEDAVSPVIGVILMVAITVILAAIIAGVVLPLASKTTVAPVASLVVSTSNATGILIQHKGGDALNLQDLRIIGSRENGANPYSVATAASAQTLVNPGDTLDIRGAATGISVSLNGANTTVTTPAGGLNLVSGTRAKVQFFHVPSGKSIADITYTVG